MQLGLHRAVIGELEAMTALWPDDETIRVLLVITLYRCGRTAEAAQACRAAVIEALEHGLDSSGLAALQRDVLTGSLPGTDLPHLPSAPGLMMQAPSGLAAFHASSTSLPRHNRTIGMT